MTNIIKAPIQKIRRKGPNGEYCIDFEDVKDTLMARTRFLNDEANDWAIVSGFIELDVLDILTKDCDGESERSYKHVYGVLFLNYIDGELKLFSLRKLMPELECW